MCQLQLWQYQCQQYRGQQPLVAVIVSPVTVIVYDQWKIMQHCIEEWWVKQENEWNEELKISMNTKAYTNNNL